MSVLQKVCAPKSVRSKKRALQKVCTQKAYAPKNLHFENRAIFTEAPNA